MLRGAKACSRTPPGYGGVTGIPGVFATLDLRLIYGIPPRCSPSLRSTGKIRRFDGRFKVTTRRRWLMPGIV